MGKIILLDTNIYLHYQPFDQINWWELLKTENVTILVPPITITELNKHKDTHQQLRVKNRAASIIKKLFEFFEENSHFVLDNGITLIHEDREPSIDFEEYQLDKKVQDDNLVASALMVKSENSNDEILIITSDFGLNLLGKARRLGVNTLRLPENLKLPDDINTEQKEIKKLEEELRKIKSKIPKVSLVFTNQDQFENFNIEKPIDLTNEFIALEIEKLKLEHPKLKVHDDKENEYMGMLLSSLYVLSKEGVEKYNNNLESYFGDYSDYLISKNSYQNLQRRTIKLEISILNEGSAPADDIDVFMYFPDGFNLLQEDEFPTAPKSPKPPHKPRNQFEAMTHLNDFAMMNYPYISTPNINTNIDFPSNISSHNIKRTNSYEVNFHIKRLKQKISEPSDILYMIFDSYENAQSFKIKYQIIIAEPPCEFSGELHIVIHKE